MEIKTLNVKNWSDVPDYWKLVTKKSKVSYETKPDNEGLVSILGEFASDDELRPAMTGVFFDNENIVTTDAHRLFVLPNKGSAYGGLYEIGKTKKIDAKFPDYRVVLGDNKNRKCFYFNILKLKTYTSTVLKSYSVNRATNMIVYSFGDNEVAGMNGEFLISILDSFEKLGYENIYIGYEANNKALYFSPDEQYVKYPSKSYGKLPLALCMPLMLWNSSDDKPYPLGSQDVDFGSSFDVYFDFEKNSIVNADGKTVNDWMPKTDWGIPYWTKDEQKLVSKITKSGSKSIYILEYVKVENKVMTCTNLDTFFMMKNFDVQDGLFLVVNGALVNTPENKDNFPLIPDEEFVNHQTFKYTQGFIEAANFVGDDDLRPIMNCVHYKVKDGTLVLEATSGKIAIHLEQKVELKDYPETDISITSPDFVTSAIGCFNQNSFGIDLSVSKSNRFFKLSKSNATYIGRIEDTKFPNMNQAKPKETQKTVVFDEKSLNKVLSMVKGQFKKEYVELYGFENETTVFTNFKNELSAKPIGSIKSDLLAQYKPPLNSYLLIASSTSTNQDGLKYQYNDLKTILNAAKYKSGTSDLLFLNGLEHKVQFVNLKNLEDIQMGETVKPKSASVPKTVSQPKAPVTPRKTSEPKKPVAPRKTTPSKKGYVVESKKEKLQQAIRGMEILAKKGNKVAATTLKGLLILYKRM